MIHRSLNRSFRNLHLLSLAIGLLFLSAIAFAQVKVEYEISFPNTAHHEAEIVATFDGVPADKALEARMSRSSPGRYAVFEFAKNVYNVRAVNEQGAPLNITRSSPNEWNI